MTDFNPNWVSAPGETISDILKERGWSVTDLACKLNQTTSFCEDLLKGKEEITDNLAERLALVLGSTPCFWKQRELIYRKRVGNFPNF